VYNFGMGGEIKRYFKLPPGVELNGAIDSKTGWISHSLVSPAIFIQIVDRWGRKKVVFTTKEKAAGKVI
jgi:hypothetical protein